ncbi:MAG: PP2C family protein-serine/threonine phosphatase [Thermoanaerobaculia bacterium]
MSLPASEVGGDFFDYVWHDPRRRELCIAIGDVAGKGMRAAMAAALSSGMLAAKIEAGGSLEEVLQSVNRLAYRRAGRAGQATRKFTAVCLACVSSASRELVYVNAAITEPLLKSGDGVRFLSTPDPRLPLGIHEEVAYREERVELRPGDVLVLYTDGVPEAQSATGELYGYDALRRRLASLPAEQMSSREILQALLADVRDFSDGCCPQQDDMTMVAVKAEAA